VKIACTFGRFQPPHLGHGRIFERLEDYKSLGYTALVFPSRTDSKPINPIPFDKKLGYLDKVCKRYGIDVVDHPDLTDPFKVMYKFRDADVEEVVFLVGADSDLKSAIARYQGLPFSNKLYIPNGYTVETISRNHYSGTKVRNYARTCNNMNGFSNFFPMALSDHDIQEIHNYICNA
jgi:hypothetical protein